jgi:DNA-binding response OmpR family regulator
MTADNKGAIQDKWSHPQTIRAGDLCLNLETRELITRDNTVRLRPLEFRLLATLMRNQGKLLTYEFLMKKVWGTEFHDDRRTLQTHVCWLRKKLGDSSRNPRYIHTDRDRGYWFRP